MTSAEILFWIDFLIACFLWFFGWACLFYIPRLQKNPSRRREKTPDISVIIPVRNEAERITPLLDSLKKLDVTPREILFVDDLSQDNTAALIKEAGYTVLSVKKKPEGWLGKSWACWIGARQAAGDLLLFLDADVMPGPQALQVLSEISRQRDGVISVLPFHRIRKQHENLSMFFTLAAMTGIDSFSLFSPPGRPHGCFGPCIMIERETYFHIGGHEAIKNELVDDVAFGNLCRANNIPVWNFGGKNTVDFRMYPEGTGDLIEGWTKNLAQASSQSAKRAIVFLTLWITGIMSCTALPFFAIFSGTPAYSIISAGTYVLYVLQIFFQSRRAGNFSFLASLFFPFPVLFFIGVFFRSLYFTWIKKQVQWKNRTIDC